MSAKADTRRAAPRAANAGSSSKINQESLPLRFGPLPGYGPTTPGEAARIRVVAAAHPGDFQIQYAATPWDADSLRSLETQFSDNASLRANILRETFRTNTLAWFGRTEDYRLMQRPIPQIASEPHPTDRGAPARLAAFDRDAAGKRLDPDNAYFPLMRAVGLYTARRDAEAQAEILRAGTKSEWIEYYDDEIMGQVRLHALAFGDHSAIWHAAVAAGVLLPDYARLRELARLATYQAMQDEQAEHIPAGTALRRALLHCGGLMRARSPFLIGSLVGIGISQTAMQRPGGAPWVDTPTQAHGDEYPPMVASNDAAFLRRHGDNWTADQVLAEDQADRQVLKVVRQIDPFEPWRFARLPAGRPLHILFAWWVTGLLLLANVFWLLACGGLSHVFRKSAAIRGRRRLVLVIVMLALGGGAATAMTQCVRDLLTLAWSMGGAYPLPRSLALLPPLTVPAALTVPLLVGLVSLLRSRRVRPSETIASVSVPAAGVVFLLYAAVIVGTARQEHVVNPALTQSLQGEGPYIAQQTAQTWPGLVDSPQ